MSNLLNSIIDDLGPENIKLRYFKELKIIDDFDNIDILTEQDDILNFLNEEPVDSSRVMVLFNRGLMMADLQLEFYRIVYSAMSNLKRSS